MKPLKVLHETYAPDGTSVTLARHDREYLMLAGGKPLMSSRMHGSEEALATLGCRGVTSDRPRVLVGGLGMGFTLRAALDRLPANATVVVSELLPAVVEWNRGEGGFSVKVERVRGRLKRGGPRHTIFLACPGRP